jgi:hypothetical protein
MPIPMPATTVRVLHRPPERLPDSTRAPEAINRTSATFSENP